MRPLPNYRHCFVCGDANPRGLDVRFRREGNAVVAHFVPGAEHGGYRGRVRGGILSALLDEAMGRAPCVQLGRFRVAAELSVRFVRPAAIGVPLLIRGELTADRGRLWETRGEIRDEAGELIARAAGTYFPLFAEESEKVLADLTIDGRAATWPEILVRSGENRRQL